VHTIAHNPRKASSFSKSSRILLEEKSEYLELYIKEQ
jgi:hypothetical protein